MEEKPRWTPPTSVAKSPAKSQNLPRDMSRSPAKCHNPNKEAAPAPPAPPPISGLVKNSPKKNWTVTPSSPKASRAPHPPRDSPVKHVSQATVNVNRPASPYHHQIKQVGRIKVKTNSCRIKIQANNCRINEQIIV